MHYCIIILKVLFTGVWILADSVFVSASIDQRVQFFTVNTVVNTPEQPERELKLLKSFNTQVSDLKGMQIYENNYILLYGCGVEVIEYSTCNLKLLSSLRLT